MDYKTERLILKPIARDDADLIYNLYNTPHFLQFIGDRNIRSLDDAQRYIVEEFLPQRVSRPYGNFVVVLESTGDKIGAVGLFDRPALEFPDIGFSFLPAYEGLGMGYESANLLVNLAFEELKLPRIGAITSTENVRSQKLIEKLGLVYGKDIRLPDADVSLLYYELAGSAKKRAPGTGRSDIIVKAR